MPDYIECPLDEATHARLVSGKVVVCGGRFIPEPYGSDLYAMVPHDTGCSEVQFGCWPDLGIVPMKVAPKPEPVTFETTVVYDGLNRDFLILVPNGVAQNGDRVRVTVEKIEEVGL